MYVYFKRFCDVVVSGIALVVLSPFLLVTAVLIKLESRPIPDRDFEFMFYYKWNYKKD